MRCETSISLINTVAKNKTFFSKKDHEGACKAIMLQSATGHPSKATLLRWIDNNLIPNCPITREDVLYTKVIYGKNEYTLKGKTIEQKAIPANFCIIPLPLKIFERNKFLTVAADILKVNTIFFLASICQRIHFCTSQMLMSMAKSYLLNGIKKYQEGIQTERVYVCYTLMANFHSWEMIYLD